MKRVTFPLLGGSAFQQYDNQIKSDINLVPERITINGFKGLLINTILDAVAHGGNPQDRAASLSVMAGDSPLSNCAKLKEF
ncbi:hypothetical protein [Moorena producens]|uniref:hypothetical protein n=1 Tax=Moorena producens TaxID=1155739 RepID=UPI003C774614